MSPDTTEAFMERRKELAHRVGELCVKARAVAAMADEARRLRRGSKIEQGLRVAARLISDEMGTVTGELLSVHQMLKESGDAETLKEGP